MPALYDPPICELLLAFDKARTLGLCPEKDPAVSRAAIAGLIRRSPSGVYMTEIHGGREVGIWEYELTDEGRAELENIRAHAQQPQP